MSFKKFCAIFYMKTNKAYVVWAVAVTFIYINNIIIMVTIIHQRDFFLHGLKTSALTGGRSANICPQEGAPVCY